MNLKLEVYCANELFDEAPTKFTVEIDDVLKNRIRNLQAAVKRLGVYEVKDFDYNGEWLAYDPDEDDVDPEDDLSCRTECNMLVVTDKDFHWEAVTKHCGDSELLRTDRTAVADLIESD